MQTKTCSKCKEEKSVEDFYKSSRYGYQAWCKKCNTQAQKDWRENSRDKYRNYHDKWYEENKNSVLKASRDRALRKYGISEEEYSRLYVSQQGICAICGKPETRKQNGKETLLCVDHDHETGRIRGLLCHTCNVGIGMLCTAELLDKAYDYLNDAKYHIESKEIENGEEE